MYCRSLFSLKFSMISRLETGSLMWFALHMSVDLFQRNTAAIGCCTWSNGADNRTAFQVKPIACHYSVGKDVLSGRMQELATMHISIPDDVCTHNRYALHSSWWVDFALLLGNSELKEIVLASLEWFSFAKIKHIWAKFELNASCSEYFQRQPWFLWVLYFYTPYFFSSDSTGNQGLWCLASSFANMNISAE